MAPRSRASAAFSRLLLAKQVLLGPAGAIYDGSNIWIADFDDDSFRKLNSDCTIARTIAVGDGPLYAVFEGINIWFPTSPETRSRWCESKTRQRIPLPIRFVLATLSGNGVDGPETAAFDGERILVANISSDSVSLWKATDLTPLGSAAGGPSTNPFGACSDGLHFWITLQGMDSLVRF